MIAYIIGWVLNLEAIFMVPACITAVIYGEQELICLLLSMGLCQGRLRHCRSQLDHHEFYGLPALYIQRSTVQSGGRHV